MQFTGILVVLPSLMVRRALTCWRSFWHAPKGPALAVEVAGLRWPLRLRLVPEPATRDSLLLAECSLVARLSEDLPRCSRTHTQACIYARSMHATPHTSADTSSLCHLLHAKPTTRAVDCEASNLCLQHMFCINFVPQHTTALDWQLFMHNQSCRS